MNDPQIDYFPDGTIAFNSLEDSGLQLLENVHLNTHVIVWYFDYMGELFELIALSDWLRQHATGKVELILPYIPNARMDRVKEKTDVFTLKTFCKLINDCKFDKIYVWSAHSNVALALLNNVVSSEPGITWLDSQTHQYDTIFLPDEGAVKRFGDLIKSFELNVVTAMKERDWKTGQIKQLKVLEDETFIKDRNIIILDDICSKGGSFKFAAIELKKLGAKSIDLFVTHCENVVDIQSLKDAGINHLYTTSSIWRGNDSFISII